MTGYYDEEINFLKYWNAEQKEIQRLYDELTAFRARLHVLRQQEEPMVKNVERLLAEIERIRRRRPTETQADYEKRLRFLEASLPTGAVLAPTGSIAQAREQQRREPTAAEIRQEEDSYLAFLDQELDIDLGEIRPPRED